MATIGKIQIKLADDWVMVSSSKGLLSNEGRSDIFYMRLATTPTALDKEIALRLKAGEVYYNPDAIDVWVSATNSDTEVFVDEFN